MRIKKVGGRLEENSKGGEEKDRDSDKEGAGKRPAFFIDKDKINDLPVGGFRGKISVISSHSPHEKVEHAVRLLSGSDVVGFDTESRPSFRVGESHPISIIQLATERRAFIFRVLRDRLPAGVKRVLEDPRVLKIGQGLKHEMRTLKKEHGVDGRGFVDLLDIAFKLDCIPKSVRGMAALFLGFRVVKSSQRSNWERDPLSEKQKRYAATDAWACLAVYRELKRRGLIKADWKMSHK